MTCSDIATYSDGLSAASRLWSGGAVLPVQVAVEHAGRLGLVAGHEVAVAVERDRDRAVAHVAAERLGVDAGGDRVGGIAVAALVEADRGKPRLPPGAPR